MVKKVGKFLKLFHAYWVCGKKYSTCTEYAVKNIQHVLSMQKKISYVYWVCGKKSTMCTEYAVKNLLPTLSMRYKNVLF